MMTVRQLSVFLENKPGRLCAATDILAKEGINLSALTLADTSEFGILRLIVDQPDRAREVLMEAGIVVRINDVLAIAMDDAPGGAVGILHLLSGAGLNIEYMYGLSIESDKAYVVLKASDGEKVDAILNENGVHTLSCEDLSNI